MLTRSQRLSHENLRLRDAQYVRGFSLDRRASVSTSRHSQSQSRERIDWLATDVHALQIARCGFENRIVVSPMAQYSAEDGVRW